MYTIEVKYKPFLKQVKHTLQDYHKSNAKLFLQSLHWWFYQPHFMVIQTWHFMVSPNFLLFITSQDITKDADVIFIITAWSVHIRSYSGPDFPTFKLDTEKYSVSLRIQSECGKIWTRITPNTDTFYAAKTNSNNLIVPSRTKFSKKISHWRVDINCKTYDSIRHHKNILWFTLWDWINTEYIYRGYSRFFNPNIL